MITLTTRPSGLSSFLCKQGTKIKTARKPIVLSIYYYRCTLHVVAIHVKETYLIWFFKLTWVIQGKHVVIILPAFHCFWWFKNYLRKKDSSWTHLSTDPCTFYFSSGTNLTCTALVILPAFLVDIIIVSIATRQKISAVWGEAKSNGTDASFTV